MSRLVAVLPRLLRSLARALGRVGPGGEMVVLGTLTGAVLAVGIAVTHDQAPLLVRIPAVTLASVASCDASTEIGLAWQLDTAAEPVAVTGVTLTGVPAPCAEQPITVSLTDAGSAVLAASSLAPAEPGGDPTRSVAFAFATPVPVVAIEGIDATIPDPIGASAALRVGTDVTTSFVDPTAGAFVVARFPSVTTPFTLTSASVTSGDPGWVAPVGFIPSTPEVIFDLAADDPAAADAEVCVYVPSSVGPDGTRFGLFRLDPATAVWSAIGETGSTTISRRICATTPGLGRFAVGFNGATTIMTTVSATTGTYGGAPITLTTTVDGTIGDGSGGILDPSGTVTIDYCYSGTVAVDTCDASARIGLAGPFPLLGDTPADGRAITTTTFPSDLSAGSYRARSSFRAAERYADSEESAGSGVAFTISPASTTSAIVASPTAPVVGQPVSLTATVTRTVGGSARLSGTITISVGATILASCAVDRTAASATCPAVTSGLPVGRNTVTASFAPDANHAASSSSATVTVGKATPLTTIAADRTTMTFGQAVLLSGVVAPPYPGPLATGTITFFDGRTKLGTCTLPAVSCTFSAAGLAVGTHTLTASYGGDANYAGTTSTALIVTVARAPAIVRLDASSATPVFGQSVTITVRLTPTAATGTVRLDASTASGTVLLGSCKLAAGLCTLATTALPAGAVTLVASYPGDTSVTPGTATTTVSVGAATTTTTLVSSASSIRAGSKMTLTATVAARTPSLAVPTGSVRYEYCRASGSVCSGSWTLIGSYALSGGTYKLSWTAPTAASYLLRARYAPTAVSQFTASDSTNVALTTTVR